MSIGDCYTHLLCLTRDMHLRAKIGLSGIQAIATYGAAHGALSVDVHLTINILRAHIAVVTCGAILSVSTAMVTVDNIV